MLPRSWDTAIEVGCKAAVCLGVWWSKAENNTFEVVTFLASTTQSNRWSTTCPLLKGSCSRWQCPFHILPGLAPGAMPEGPVQSCPSKNPQLRCLSLVTPASFLQHLYVKPSRPTQLYPCDFPVHPLLAITLCPAESSLYPAGRMLVSEVRNLPGCHNLSLAATLLDALIQTPARLFRELLWSNLLLNVEMTPCIIPISGAAPASANHGQSGFMPSLSSETWAPHTGKREARSSVGLQSHIMLSSGVPPPPRSSQ